MTQISTPVSTTACFSWETERPFNDIPRKSCNFSFLGAEWWLELKRSDYDATKNSFIVTLKMKTKKELGRNYDINVLTVVKINNIPILRGNYQISKKFNFHGFTETYESQLKNEYPSSFNYGAWKIICVFEGIPPPASEKTSLKRDFSIEVDANASTAASEKSSCRCTVHSCQVSRDSFEMEKLPDDFSNLLLSPLYSDAKLSIGNRSVHVHRSILATRSQVFKTMFQDESSDIFEVKDVDDKTLDLLLKYVYTGTVIPELSDDTAIDLYDAGQKYGIDSLTKVCSDWMIDHLTEENCVSFLAVANFSGNCFLKEAVISFIFDHPDVFFSPRWNGFAEDEVLLAYKLIHMYTKRTLKLG